MHYGAREPKSCFGLTYKDALSRIIDLRTALLATSARSVDYILITPSKGTALM